MQIKMSETFSFTKISHLISFTAGALDYEYQRLLKRVSRHKTKSVLYRHVIEINKLTYNKACFCQQYLSSINKVNK